MTSHVLTDFSTHLADVVAAAAPSVVQVHGRRRPASGVVYSEDVVLTTARALGPSDRLGVRTDDGRALDAELAGWDPATGLAVLRVANLASPALAPSAVEARVGHLAVAVARSWSNATTASAGIVSVIGGPLRTGRGRAIERVIRVTTPMHDGFAGAALVDSAGGLVGIATAATIRGLGVVIPAAIAWKTAVTVLESGTPTRAFLGLVGQPVVLSDHQSAPEGRRRGLLVVGVTNGSPAGDAGVIVGDVLLAFDGHPVESPEDLLELLTGDRAGRAATLEVLRGGAATTIEVVAGRRAVS